MKEKKLFIWAAVVLFLIPIVSAFPSFLVLKGNLTINNTEAPVGTLISGYIIGDNDPDIADGAMTTTEIGKYYLIVQGDSSYKNKEVIIKINGEIADQNLTFDLLNPFLDLSLNYPSLVNIGLEGGKNNVFSPNGDGFYDTIEIDMLASEVVNWGITSIYDSNGSEVRRYDGKENITTNNIVWDGRYNNSEFASNGVYYVNTSLIDRANNINGTLLVTELIIDNALPVISGIPGVSIPEDSNESIHLYNLSLYTDLDGLTYSVYNQTNSQLISCYVIDRIFLNCNRPAQDKTGFNDIVVSISNGNSFSLSNAFRINVVEVPDAPLITSLPIRTAIEGILYEYNVTATDVDNGDNLTYSLLNGPIGMQFLQGGMISWLPTGEDSGVQDILIEASDTYGLKANQSYNLTVYRALEISDLSVEIDGVKNLSLVNGSVLDNVRPGSVIKINFNLENLLDKDIVSVEASSNLFNEIKSKNIDLIKKKEKKNIDFMYIVPSKIDVSKYELSIITKGTDIGRNIRENGRTLFFDVTKNSDKIIIEDAEILYNNLKCIRETDLNLTLANAGSNPQEDVKLKISNSALGLDITKENISINVNNNFNELFKISTNNINPGTYPIKVKISYFHDYYSEEKDVNLIVNNCNLPDQFVDEDTWPNWQIDLWQYGGDSRINASEFIYGVVEQKNSDLINCGILENRYFNCSNPNANLTGYNDINISYFNGKYYGSSILKVIVKEINDAPVLDLIEKIEIAEDNEVKINLSEYVRDADSTKFIWHYSGNENIIISIVDGVATLKPRQDWYGEEKITFIVEDLNGGSDSDLILVKVTPAEDAPKILSYSPNYDPLIGKDEIFTFSVEAIDVDSTEPKIEWYLDGVLSGNSKSLIINNWNVGKHNLTVKVLDGGVDSKEWLIEVKDKPVTNIFKGSTTNFAVLSQNELASVKDVVLEKVEKGKIEFKENLDLRSVIDMDNAVKLEENVVAIDTIRYGQLNKPARITLKGLSYNSIPKIFYDGGFTTNGNNINNECDFCTLVNYTQFPTTNGEVIFEVGHFSSFKIGSSGQKYDLNLLDELDTCEKGIQGNLLVDIREPNNGDDFKPGEEIEIEVKVRNKKNDDKDVIIEASLYDLDEDEETESVEEDIEIDEGKSEIITLNMSVPEDSDEKDDYLLFVKAYEDGEEETQCNYDFVDIDLKLKKHDIIIKDIQLMPKTVNPGGTTQISVKAENIGIKDEEDVYIELKNEDLGINLISDKFDLDKNKRVTKEFKITIPERIEFKNYDIEADVYFSSETNSKMGVLTIKNPIKNKVVEVQGIKDNIVGLRDIFNLYGETIVIKNTLSVHTIVDSSSEEEKVNIRAIPVGWGQELSLQNEDLHLGQNNFYIDLPINEDMEGEYRVLVKVEPLKNDIKTEEISLSFDIEKEKGGIWSIFNFLN